MSKVDVATVLKFNVVIGFSYHKHYMTTMPLKCPTFPIVVFQSGDFDNVGKMYRMNFEDENKNFAVDVEMAATGAGVVITLTIQFSNWRNNGC